MDKMNLKCVMCGERVVAIVGVTVIMDGAGLRLRCLNCEPFLKEDSLA